MDNPSNDNQDYGTQPPIIPGEDAANPIIDDDSAAKDSIMKDDVRSAAPESTSVSSDHLPMINDIIGKIDEANNILVALSANPSVDELATAIALSLSLDKLEKRVTAIYSGETPDALSFLKPEDTFESQPDALQDFVIALNKDKADHLRYKIDGDYVKIFITPYRSRISQEDLEFSYGDFNVDLVIALDVANGVDLDSALREHGRIMHDATIVNITTAKPGKLGEVEWSDTKASSVAEMVAELLLAIGKLEKPEATALLTGIIAATDRFANSHTTSHSLEIASQLVSAGANQQLIAKNIASELDGDNLAAPKITPAKEKISLADSIREKAIAKESEEDDPMSLDIRHHDEPAEPEEEPSVPTYQEVLGESESEHNAEDEDTEPEPSVSSDEPKSSNEEETEEEREEEALTEDLEATEAGLSTAGAEVVPEVEKKPFSLEVNTAKKEVTKEEPKDEPEGESVETTEEESKDEDATTNNQSSESKSNDNDADGDGIVGPFGSDDDEEGSQEPEEQNPASDFISNKAEKTITPPSSMNSGPANPSNPATSSTPESASAPEVNNIPDMNYMPMPGDEILPPPPTPPVDFNAEMPPLSQAMPDTQPTTSMPNMAQPAPSANSNPFLNPMSAQNPLLSNASAGPSMPNAGSPMPQMHSANPFATPPSMPGSNSNPFAAQPTMPNQSGMPGQMGNNQPMNNPGSFQIPGM